MPVEGRRMHSNVLPEDAFTILMDGDIDGNEIRMRVEAQGNCIK